MREPDRKVKADVEKEWAGRFQKLQNQLDSKTIWANRLDENMRKVTHEKRVLEGRCRDAEAKVLAVFEWVNSALSESEPGTVDENDPLPMLPPLPELSNADANCADFGPAVGQAAEQLTLTMNKSRMRRTGNSQRNLQNEFHDWFAGSLSRPPRGSLLRNDSVPVLASVDDDEMF